VWNAGFLETDWWLVLDALRTSEGRGGLKGAPLEAREDPKGGTFSKNLINFILRRLKKIYQGK